jgi:hypothetical protein
MVWVIGFASIAAVGLIMLASYGVWLAHKAADVMSEVNVVLNNLGALAVLASQITFPQARWSPDDERDLIGAVATRASESGDVR